MKYKKIIIIIFISILLIILFTYINDKKRDNNLVNDSNNNTNNITEIEQEKTVSENELKIEVDKNYKLNNNLQASAYDNTYKNIFKTNEIQKVNINMYEKNYTYLIENAKDKPYVLIDSITIDETLIGYAGMKTKGVESLNNAKLNKYSFSINTSKYTKNQLGFSQNLYGIEKISLNNMNEDTTFLKDYLSYYLMSELGICTPYYSITQLFINNENKGIYLLLENIEDDLIKRCYNETGNFLTKPELLGGDLVYIKELDNYIDKNGNYKFDIDNYEDEDNILQKYSGIFEEKASGEEITDKNADKEVLEKEINMFFKWLKKLNTLSNTKNKNTLEFEKEVESIMDIESVIKYFAGLIFLVSDDSYLGITKHNYGLYIDENMKMNIIPWDFNLSFGNFYTNAYEMINRRIDKSGLKISPVERPLINIILDNKKYSDMFYYYLDTCTKITMGGEVNGKVYEENNFINIIDNIDNKLVKIMDEKVDYYTISQHKKGIYTLKEIIRLRTKSVKQQLEGNFKKLKVYVDLTDLGRGIK